LLRSSPKFFYLGLAEISKLFFKNLDNNYFSEKNLISISLKSYLIASKDNQNKNKLTFDYNILFVGICSFFEKYFEFLAR
jgi:TorA maturation chaperone TorD